ncbi:MAG: helix-turn-helix domain-containing protein [Pseudomonadota bacterium]
MERASMIGSRIRERRVMAGMKQADLARAAGISASYLNLIEHNRRRIGGKTLNQLADVLEVPAGILAEGAEAALVTALRDAIGEDARVEADRAEEFAGRFPGWAGLVADLARQREELTQTVNALTDRIAHDPELATSLHEVISTVTAIRSTASILADGQSLEPQWQSRFHRNINEDSMRLASEAEALVRYLEGAPGADMAVRSPLEQVHAFLSAHDHHFSELEGAGGSARVASLIARSDHLISDPARQVARAVLDQYVQDARALPLGEMRAALDEVGVDPLRLSQITAQPLATVARRLANLPEEMVPPVGIFICDSSGRMIVQKPVLGMDVIRPCTACQKWPLFEVLCQPGRIVERRIRQGDLPFCALAMPHEVRPATLNQPAVIQAQMVILPDTGAGEIWPVGAVCHGCAFGHCQADEARA